MDRQDFEQVVSQAMLAPSAHNTQPARWALRDGAIEIYADLFRRLPVGDPTDRDLEVSCGAAVEGTVLAMAAHGVGAKVTLAISTTEKNLRPIARIVTNGAPDNEDIALASLASARLTHRGGFAPTPQSALQGWMAEHLTLVTETKQIDWLAEQIDIASARVMRPKPFRTELLHWMRLRKGDVNYDVDGLNRDVLAMDAITARMVPVVLGSGVYDLLSSLGLGPQLSGEAARSRKAGAIALFHWPADRSMVRAGRAFYRTWLQASARGLVGWPAAALADDPDIRAAVTERLGVPRGRVLFNALRLGVANKATPSRARLSLREVIV